MGLSILREFSRWFRSHSAWPSQSVLISCTNRTPRSTMRRASRQMRPNLAVEASSIPYIPRMCSGSFEISIISGAAVCIRNASS